MPSLTSGGREGGRGGKGKVGKGGGRKEGRERREGGEGGREGVSEAGRENTRSIVSHTNNAMYLHL